MIVCDMCGKKKIVKTIEFKEADPFSFTSSSLFQNHDDEYDLCKKCSQKLKRFIEFERARSNKH